MLSDELPGDKMRGVYRTKNVAPNGLTVFAATTHFEPVEARRAFPCWDEPSDKATFDVTLIVLQNRVTLSSMVSDTAYILAQSQLNLLTGFLATPFPVKALGRGPKGSPSPEGEALDTAQISAYVEAWRCNQTLVGETVKKS